MMVADFPRIFLGGNLFGYSMSAEQAGLLIQSATHELRKIGVDTANVYSDGRSEEIIGRVIKANRLREKFFISTKAGTNSLESFAGFATYSKLKKTLTSSLRRLQTDYVDLFSLQHPDLLTPWTETLAAVEKLFEEGLIRGFGISNPVLETLQKELGPVTALHIYGNWVKEERIKEVHSLGNQSPHIMMYGVLGRGLLVRPVPSDDANSRVRMNPRIAKEYSKAFSSAIREIERELETIDMSLLGLVKAHAQQNEASVVIGFRTEAQLQAYARLRLSEKQVSAALELAQNHRDVFLELIGVSLGESRRVDRTRPIDSAP